MQFEQAAFEAALAGGQRSPSRRDFQFRFVMRTRPDGRPGPNVGDAIASAIAIAGSDEQSAIMFIRRGQHSDGLALLTRNAASAYGSIFSEFLDIHCMSLPWTSTLPTECQRLHVGTFRPECMIYGHVTRPEFNTSVQINNRLTYATLRPSDTGPARTRDILRAEQENMTAHQRSSSSTTHRRPPSQPWLLKPQKRRPPRQHDGGKRRLLGQGN